jgi:hypothetical protein
MKPEDPRERARELLDLCRGGGANGTGEMFGWEALHDRVTALYEALALIHVDTCESEIEHEVSPSHVHMCVLCLIDDRSALEDQCDRYESSLVKANAQRDRYKEALEWYADMTRRDAMLSKYEDDGGERARKALAGE